MVLERRLHANCEASGQLMGISQRDGNSGVPVAPQKRTKPLP